VHYALYTPGLNGDPGVWTQPEPIPGAVKFSPSAQGSEYTFYADNGKYFTYRNDTGDAGDLEMAYFPDKFLIDTLNWQKDKNGGLLEITGKPQHQFALLFEVNGVGMDGEESPIRVVYYNVTGSKPTTSYATTTEGIEVQTQTMSLTCAPIKFTDFGYLTKARMTEKDSDEFPTFFDQVYIPAKV